jgi:hypothetical protein
VRYSSAGGSPMPENILLRAGTVEITPKLARFSNTSYQVANIGSVSVNIQRKLHTLVIFLIIMTVGSLLMIAALHEKSPDKAWIAAAVATLSARFMDRSRLY